MSATHERLRGWLSRGVVVLLLGFHLGLFATHVVDGRIGKPAIALRWLVGAALFSSLVALRRVTGARLRGRRAIILWLLVVLLHCHAAAYPSSSGPRTFSWPDVLATVLTSQTATVTLVAVGLLLLLGKRNGTRRARPASWRPQRTSRAPLLVSHGFALVLSPRPPPLR